MFRNLREMSSAYEKINIQLDISNEDEDGQSKGESHDDRSYSQILKMN